MWLRALVVLGVGQAGAQHTCAAGTQALEFRVSQVSNPNVDCVGSSQPQCRLYVTLNYTGAPLGARTQTVSLAGGTGGVCFSAVNSPCDRGTTIFSDAVSPFQRVCLAEGVRAFSVAMEVREETRLPTDVVLTTMTVTLTRPDVTAPFQSTALVTGPPGYTVSVPHAWLPYTVVCGSNVTGDTSNGASDIGGLSSSTPNGAHLYLFRPPTPGIYRFSACNSAIFPFFHFSTYNANGNLGLGTRMVRCSGSCEAASIPRSSDLCTAATNYYVELTLASSDPLVITVEGSQSAGPGFVPNGTYFLHITCPPTHSPTAAPVGPRTIAPISAAPASAAPASASPTSVAPTPLSAAPTSAPSASTVPPTFFPSAPTLPPTTTAPLRNPTAAPIAATGQPSFATAQPSVATNQPTPTVASNQPTTAVSNQPTGVTPASVTGQPTGGGTAAPSPPTAAPTATLSAEVTGGGAGGPSFLIIIIVVVVVVLLMVMALLGIRRKRNGPPPDRKSRPPPAQPAVPDMFLNPLHKGAATYEAPVAHNPMYTSGQGKRQGASTSAAPAGLSTYEAPVTHNPQYSSASAAKKTSGKKRGNTTPTAAPPEGFGRYEVPVPQNANYAVPGAHTGPGQAENRGSVGSRSVRLDPQHYVAPGEAGAVRLDQQRYVAGDGGRRPSGAGAGSPVYARPETSA